MTSPDGPAGTAGNPRFRAPYPRHGPEGVPEPTGWRRWALGALIPLLILGGSGGVVVFVFALLYSLNPMGDEWVCSDGEAPAGNACYPVDETLPAGVRWDPLGNRPMPYNCNKDGWTPIEHDRRDEKECLNDELPMPAGWHEAG
jgi:hypothetical protein